MRELSEQSTKGAKGPARGQGGSQEIPGSPIQLFPTSGAEGAAPGAEPCPGFWAGGSCPEPSPAPGSPIPLGARPGGAGADPQPFPSCFPALLAAVQSRAAQKHLQAHSHPRSWSLPCPRGARHRLLWDRGPCQAPAPLSSRPCSPLIAPGGGWSRDRRAPAPPVRRRRSGTSKPGAFSELECGGPGAAANSSGGSCPVTRARSPGGVPGADR